MSEHTYTDSLGVLASSGPERERAIRAGVEAIDAWIESDGRGYIKADEYEVVSRVLDAVLDWALVARGWNRLEVVE